MIFYISQDDAVCDIVEAKPDVIVAEDIKCQYIINKEYKIISAYNGNYRPVQSFGERYAKRINTNDTISWQSGFY